MKRDVMARIAACTLVVGILVVLLGCPPPAEPPPQDPGPAEGTVAVAVPSRGGAVDGTTQGSDEFIWNLLTQFMAPVVPSQPSPVVFETWASDADTFSTSPHWPEPGEPKKFQRSVLGAQTTQHFNPIDVPCNNDVNAAVGGFPTTGCIAEEVKRNRPQFDYIVENNLNTKAGLAAAYANGFDVAMPTAAIAVKGDWIPVEDMLEWIPELEGSIDRLRELYYTTTSDTVEYALVAMHVSSRQNTNWVWGTYEHHLNPGRCDNIGCFDSFGAVTPAVAPNNTTVNTQYGPCPKTQPLLDLMAQANLSPVWQNYCLKSTQVDYSAADDTPYALGSSVIERITGNGTVSASSCIACHVYASFGPDGAPTVAAKNMLPYNPTGPPIDGVLEGSLQFDFMWGVLLAP